MRRKNKKTSPPKLVILFSFLALSLFSIPFSSAATPISNAPIDFPVFLVLAGISLFFILIGIGARIPFFTIIGFFTLFIIGFVIQAGNLYLPAGLNETVNGNITTTVKIYEPWNTGNYHLIGWFTMIAGLMASFFSVFATFRED